eukprot:2607652-Rhodomonas_salina.1
MEPYTFVSSILYGFTVPQHLTDLRDRYKLTGLRCTDSVVLNLAHPVSAGGTYPGTRVPAARVLYPLVGYQSIWTGGPDL